MFNVLDKTLWVELKLITLEREAHEYSYFSLGGYDVTIKDKGRVEFDFDISSGYIDNEEGIFNFILQDQGEYFDRKITFEDFKNITNWNEFYYTQDIDEGDKDIQERIKVIEFKVCNDKHEEYLLPQNVLDMINNCINDMLNQ